MKKILVLLLILAVAGGLFAQDGEWSLSGKVHLYTKVDFDNSPTMVSTDGLYGDGYGDGNIDNHTGALDLSYSLEGMKAYLGFSVNPSKVIIGNPYGGEAYDEEGAGLNAGVEFYGENYAFKAEAPLALMLMTGGWEINSLWGYYEMLNQMIHLELAYKGRWNNWWQADTTAYFAEWTNTDTNYTYSEGNYLLTNVSLANLGFGILIPHLFTNRTVPNTAPYPGDNSVKVDLIENSIKKSIFGFRFDMQPFVIAAQFAFERYGAYFGAQYSVGPVKVGLSFQGYLDGMAEVKAGGSVEYSAEGLGAKISGYLWRETDGGSPLTVDTVIGIEPAFWYDVIPTHLRFRTDLGFYFLGQKVGGTKIELDPGVQWMVVPQITWNFLGTGAQGIGDIATGIGVKYTLKSKDANALYVGFKFGF
jgi:hypothetical protein